MKPMPESILIRLKRLIRERMSCYIGQVTIEDDTCLFGGGLNLDSIAVIELINLTEAHFDVRYREEDLSEDNFRTILALAELLGRRGAD